MKTFFKAIGQSLDGVVDRVLYFGYVVLTSIRHRGKILTFSRALSEKYKHSASFFILMAFYHYVRYGMHPLDYFYFNIYENKEFNPLDYASTLFMYRFHKKLNKKRYTDFFQNKILFNEHFRRFMGHDFVNLKSLNNNELKNWISKHGDSSLIIKKHKSVGGFGVKRIRIKIENEQLLIDDKKFEERANYLKEFDLLEEFVHQHERLDILNSSCLNTVRIVTVLDHTKNVNIIGAVLRVGVNSDVDNFHSGGIAVRINLESGCLEGSGFKLDPGEPSIYPMHPVTNIEFDGYCLPHWNILLEAVSKACFVFPEVRTIGWDVAITPRGVSLIEGNHDWDKIIIEKSLKRGIRKDLERFL